jgi:hypothetical protein
MSYVEPNFLTKKALKEAVAAGKYVTVYQPGPFGGGGPMNGKSIVVEGPHYPKPHTWYATVEAVDGVVLKVR